jgi:hypothetical protein
MLQRVRAVKPLVSLTVDCHFVSVNCLIGMCCWCRWGEVRDQKPVALAGLTDGRDQGSRPAIKAGALVVVMKKD